MSRNVAIAAVAIVVAFALQLVWVSSVSTRVESASGRIAGLRDSLDILQRSLDSLKAFTPGLGEYMSTIQLHTAKLWFAGRAGNRDLAGYECDELEETLEAVEALHARKNNVDITSVLQGVRETQLQALREAINEKRMRRFEKMYEDMLGACNGCHRAAGYAFIHIIPPHSDPVSNQQWKPDDEGSS